MTIFYCLRFENLPTWRAKSRIYIPQEQGVPVIPPGTRFPHSQSQSYFTTGGLPPINSSWRQAPWDSRLAMLYQLNTCCHSPYVTSFLRRGCVCRLQLLLTIVSAVILESESRGTHNHISLSQIRDSLNLEDQVLVFLSPRNRVAQLHSQALLVMSWGGPTENTASSYVACWFIAAGMCLPRCFLAMDLSDFTIPDFGRHVTIHMCVMAL
jgi:hypothetical protein